jgi:hypothetical protein
MLACYTATPAPDTGADMDTKCAPAPARLSLDYNKPIPGETAEEKVVHLGDEGVVPPFYGKANYKKRALIEKCDNSISSLDSQEVPGTDVAIEEGVALAERKEARQERRFKRKKSTCPGCIGDSPSQTYCIRFGGCCYYDDDEDSDVSSNYSEKILVIDTDTEQEEYFHCEEMAGGQEEMTLAVNREYIESKMVVETIESEQEGESRDVA